MRLHHTERLTESVARLAAEFLARHPGEGLATVTGARLDRTGRSATIFLTVFPTEIEAKALASARAIRSELRDYLDERLRGNSLTHVDFALDARPRA